MAKNKPKKIDTLNKLIELNNQDPVEFRFKVFKAIGYTPHKFQEKVHRCGKKIRAVAAAARIGKTYLASREIIARIHYPTPQMIWCVGPTYALAEKVFREVWNYLHTPRIKKILPIVRHQRQNMLIELFNGTIIEGKSTDNEDSLLGEGVDFMVIDEASRVADDVFTRYLETRTLTSDGDMLIISTPCGKNSRFHQYYLEGKDPDNPKVASFHGTLFDNPLIPDSAIEYARERELTDPIGYRQEYLGEFVDHEGTVFPSFDPDIFFQDVPILDNIPIDASIDPGYRNPFACLFLQRKGRQLRVFKEYYKANVSTLEHAEYLKPIFEALNVRRCVVDPREPDALDTLQKIIPGTSFVPGPAKEVNVGLQVIRDHLTIDEDSKKPFLVCDKDNCKKLAWEFERAHYKKGNKEEPADVDNHAISALRYYALMYCNRLRRTDAGFFASSLKTTPSFFDIIKGKTGVSKRDMESRPWMGDN